MHRVTSSPHQFSLPSTGVLADKACSHSLLSTDTTVEEPFNPFKKYLDRLGQSSPENSVSTNSIQPAKSSESDIPKSYQATCTDEAEKEASYTQPGRTL